ncbi:Pimeloyl-ACP methyl ester carboxylesterase [Parasphingorhabdus marina DSM 22363]|uniref:Pimeloyl-ACP methyl ester carboxylesterase n=1 Tax=Parasphingorhabdus marina DSM 22363 TaxID=1123272 RepID=A0A1N6GP65_9SPHN|nr:alpha/beta fold hydrolase [Parasphingorhabdus marina]SIO09265.1 Pimeloyl-ACP methyl ester carboxylesterase [Parasphingorhabdus marina DSM 22363]
MGRRRQIAYFHGVPGSPAELDLVRCKKPHELDVFVPDRLVCGTDRDLSESFRAVADQIEQRYPDGRIEIIGFSLGTYFALQVAPFLSQRIDVLHLVSSTAPLQWSGYLEDMAGKAVFGMARENPGLFGGMTSIQSFMARYFPNILFKLLFASSRGEDRNLIGDSRFESVLSGILTDSLGHGSRSYQAEIMGYSNDWLPQRNLSEKKIILWHGQKDNWSPVQMAHDLQAYFGEGTELKEFPGLSHYSTLQYALHQILCDHS